MIIRNSTEADGECLSMWLDDPHVMRWFPVCDKREIDDTIRIWLGYRKQETALTIEKDGKPVGMAVLYLHPYKKIAHQALFAIIIDKNERGKGYGTLLLQAVEKRAKEKGVSLLHLEVYEGNPAERLYARSGFVEYARHPHFIKDSGEYLTKIMMQKTI
ncbi:MAG: GNAT family N-acetyltransferase [Simkaniaceae bacterium]|nr:GNAT family N-acetyltransferase [Simkaniaceae bacterium]